MLRAAAPFQAPDPMHLDPGEERDEPLAHDRHHREQDYCCAVLLARFAGPECYVTRDLWLLMDPANPADKLLPDLVVALGVPDALRGDYDPVAEGKPPDLLAEFLSKESLAADMAGKSRRYAELGVREYWVFNPWGEFAAPRIQGWALRGLQPPEPLPLEADGSVASRVLPVRFAVREDLLEILDAATGESLSPLRAQALRIERETRARLLAEDLARREAEARHQEAAARRQEAETRHALEQEVERLRRQLKERA